MKGHTQSSSSSSSSSRGRSYGLMLLLAFGAALLGFMALHKFRERRIFNLLLKQKDHDLISLHILLQKERDYAKETKRKTEEMKANIYSLRAQKMELDSRILEMQSTISSLKDEQRAMESTLEEKHNEIKFLRGREIDLNKENPQVTALFETLRQKEAEIEDLKHRLDLPFKVWSVSTDDPSKPAVNLTTTVGGLHESNKYDNGKNLVRDTDGSGNESVDIRDGEHLTKDVDGKENRMGIADTREMTGEEQSRMEISKEGDFGHGSTSGKSRDEGKEKIIKDSQNGGGFGVRNEENKANATEAISNVGVEVQKPRDEDSDVKPVDRKELGSMRDGQLGKQANYKGGMKLEIPDDSRNGATYRLRGNHANVRKAKGKRWRIISKDEVPEKKGNSEDNGVTSTRGRRFFKDALESESNKRIKEGELPTLIRHQDHDMGLNDSHKEDGKLNTSDELQQTEGLKSKIDDHVGFKNRGKKAALNGEGMKTGEKDEESPPEPKNGVISTNAKLPMRENSEGTENRSDKVGNTDIDQQAERRQQMDVEVTPERTVDGEGSGADDEVGQSEQTEGSNVNKVDYDSKQAKVADKYEEPEDSEVEDIQESNTDISREYSSKLEEDKEEYKEELEEPDF